MDLKVLKTNIGNEETLKDFAAFLIPQLLEACCEQSYATWSRVVGDKLLLEAAKIDGNIIRIYGMEPEVGDALFSVIAFDNVDQELSEDEIHNQEFLGDFVDMVNDHVSGDNVDRFKPLDFDLNGNVEKEGMFYTILEQNIHNEDDHIIECVKFAVNGLQGWYVDREGFRIYESGLVQGNLCKVWGLEPKSGKVWYAVVQFGETEAEMEKNYTQDEIDALTIPESFYDEVKEMAK